LTLHLRNTGRCCRQQRSTVSTVPMQLQGLGRSPTSFFKTLKMIKSQSLASVD
jgi:hypothetical protein